MSSPSNNALINRAASHEQKAEQLREAAPAKHHQEIERLYQEASNLREWAIHGCLIGRPDSTWSP